MLKIFESKADVSKPGIMSNKYIRSSYRTEQCRTDSLFLSSRVSFLLAMNK